MCDKAVKICPFVFNSIPYQFKIQEMCDKVVSKEPFMLKYCPYKCKNQEMCDKAADFFRLH